MALAIVIAALGCGGERVPLKAFVDPRADDRDAHQGITETQARGSWSETMSISDSKKVRATGRTVVRTYEPKVFDDLPGGPTLAGVHLTETFSGDLEGGGVVQGVQAARPDGSSSFVGIERFRGSLHDKKGTFLLQVQRTVVGKDATGAWFVMPGSGTGELRGLRGDGGFKAELGQRGAIWLDYYFEGTP